jgi:glycosyltransferase involved in cell wall biosynthesis
MPESPENHENPGIVLVTPVWKDSARLARYGPSLARALADHPRPVRWIIADDGSGPAEHTRLAALRDDLARIHPQVETHFAAAHVGKGGVIHEAWALAPEADWLAFVDADGSAPPEDVLRIIENSVQSGLTTLGIRKRTESTRLKETLWRGLAHRMFLLAVHLILGLRRATDPQCGLKCIKGADYRRVAGQLAESGLAFDSEMLAALSRSGAEWSERPVNWIQMKGGKIHPARDAWPMLAALWRIRNRWKNPETGP